MRATPPATARLGGRRCRSGANARRRRAGRAARGRGPVKPEAVARAERAARALLRGLPAALTYHDVRHTFDIVLPAARRYAAAEGLDRRQRGLVSVAAAFHDTGFAERYEGHEAVSADVAGRTLGTLGFAAADIDAVRRMILATRVPQAPETLAEMVLADADLDVLGREDFWEANLDLRRELAQRGEAYTDDEWLERQIAFVEAHRYFTAAARKARGRQERANLARLRSLLRSGAGR